MTSSSLEPQEHVQVQSVGHTFTSACVLVQGLMNSTSPRIFDIPFSICCLKVTLRGSTTGPAILTGAVRGYSRATELNSIFKAERAFYAVLQVRTTRNGRSNAR